MQGVVLKKGKEVIFENRHLWIFSGAIASYPSCFQNGHIYPVYSVAGELLGSAYFNKGQSLAGRVVARGNEDPMQALFSRLDEAIALRDKLFEATTTNAYRLVNGEGDGVAGLVIDQYGEYLVVQSGSLGMDFLKEKIVEYLVSKKRWKGIFEKSVTSSRKEEKLPERVAILWGEDKEELEILENGFKFKVSWRKGQKTGFFLDQREMRSQVQTLSRGKRVLNVFSYSGGFSVYAMAGGAKGVDSLDISSQAIQWAKENQGLNGFVEGRFLEEDAFTFLAKDPLDYDMIILDPPAFAKKKQDLPQASKGYREINYQALSKMPKGSLLLTCSCSYHVGEELFQTLIFQAAKKAGRFVQVLSRHILAKDHPVNLFHPESHYLKSLFLYVS
ncbi:MAG: class I SAM-dependent rRNA methyltransferase [Chlamydiae bacterium]|nr:class I SAM-dependent rRNA methyltransferase [Chlamydiota bacterium]